jgi:hypothetical protein
MATTHRGSSEKKAMSRARISLRARGDDLACRVDGVNLKRVLRQIEPDARDSGQIPDRLAHGRLPFEMGFMTTTILAHQMPFGAPSTPSTVIAGELVVDWHYERR